METSHKFKKTQCFHSGPLLQNGSISHLKDLLPGDFLVKVDLKDATNESSLLEISPFRVEGNSLRIQNSPIRFSNSSDNIHKITSPSSSLLTVPGNTPSHILRRHPASCPDISIGNSSSVSHDRLTRIAGLHSQSEEVCPRSIALPRVSGVSSGHKINDTVFATRESTEDLLPLASNARDLPETIGTSDQADVIDITSSTPSPPPLQDVTEDALPSSGEVTTGLRRLHSLIQEVRQDLEWWTDQMPNHNGRRILPSQAKVHLESDASKQGWEAYCRTTQQRTGVLWSTQDQRAHINVLELQAAFLTIQTFLKSRRNIHVLIYLHNTVAVQYINCMGGTQSPALCYLAIELWEWCLARKITLHAEYLPGRCNIRADFESRHHNDSSNWRLNPQIFSILNQTFGPFSTDLFASFQNAQVGHFFSWKLDPQAAGIDALLQLWDKLQPYAFPPLALIGRCLQKAWEERVAHLLLIAQYGQHRAGTHCSWTC